MPNCSRKDCPGIGRFMPVLLIRANKKSTVTQVRLTQLFNCQGHMESALLPDFLSDEGWAKIAKYMREAGKGSFSKNLTTLTWDTSKEIEKADSELPF